MTDNLSLAPAGADLRHSRRYSDPRSILSARVGRNSPDEGRVEPDMVYVDLALRVTALDDADYKEGDFGIVVDGATTRPVDRILEYFDVGTTHPLHVTFEVPDDTTAFELRFRVGWHSDLEPRSEWIAIPVDLTDAAG